MVTGQITVFYGAVENFLYHKVSVTKSGETLSIKRACYSEKKKILLMAYFLNIEIEDI